MSDTPTSRSLKLLRKEGWLAAVVEKWNAHVKVRQDLWGFGDLIAVKDNTVMLIQATSDNSGGHSMARIQKIQGNAAARIWLMSPNRRIQVFAWVKRGPRGKRKLWECRRVAISLDDLATT